MLVRFLEILAAVKTRFTTEARRTQSEFSFFVYREIPIDERNPGRLW